MANVSQRQQKEDSHQNGEKGALVRDRDTRLIFRVHERQSERVVHPSRLRPPP